MITIFTFSLISIFFTIAVFVFIPNKATFEHEIEYKMEFYAQKFKFTLVYFTILNLSIILIKIEKILEKSRKPGLKSRKFW